MVDKKERERMKRKSRGGRGERGKEEEENWRRRRRGLDTPKILLLVIYFLQLINRAPAKDQAFNT